MRVRTADARHGRIRSVPICTGRSDREAADLFQDSRSSSVLSGLERLRTVNQDLADAYELKEELRRIYRFAESPYDAMLQFRSWMAKANATEVPELVAMAGMIRRHQKGMLGFWKLNCKSSASMEGFNGKVRWLMKQAYGFRDFKFLRLKIFDLPSTDTKRHL